MINCKECGNEVDSKFKFSISKNVCPVCGGSIFEKEKHEMLGYIIKTMSSQSFAEKIGEDMISEISSFIFFEFLDVDEDYEDMDSLASSELSEYEENQFDESLSDDNISEDQQLDKNTPVLDDEDVMSRAERLKGVYKNDIKKMKPKTGVRVSRISS